MKPWRLREFHPEDLDQLVEVWQESRNPARPAVYSLSEVLSACTEQQAVVAMAGDRLIGQPPPTSKRTAPPTSSGPWTPRSCGTDGLTT